MSPSIVAYYDLTPLDHTGLINADFVDTLHTVNASGLRIDPVVRADDSLHTLLECTTNDIIPAISEPNSPLS